jgi:RNA polymerase sigma-70 factor (ECF subfamily)
LVQCRPKGLSSQSFRKVPHLYLLIKSRIDHFDIQERITPMTAETPACFAVEFESNRREATDMCSPHDEINMKLLAAATDDVLIVAAKSGDRPAFVELWTRHSKIAFNMAYRITGNQEDAEDVVQDAWLRAYVHLNSFDGRSKFSTWLTRIAINSALGILRRKRARPETSMEITDGETWQPWEIADETKNIEDLYARQQRGERLRRAIRRLQPTLRNVVEIHQSNDRSVKEIADLAGISVAATKSRLLRARRILRKTLVAY